MTNYVEHNFYFRSNKSFIFSSPEDSANILNDSRFSASVCILNISCKLGFREKRF